MNRCSLIGEPTREMSHQSLGTLCKEEPFLKDFLDEKIILLKHVFESLLRIGQDIYRSRCVEE